MFTKRIIPCLDVNNGRVVKGVNFVNLKDAGDPVEIAAAYDLAIDAKKRANGEGWTIYKHGGRIDTGIDAVEWAKRVCDLGAGEILLTSMDCDGTKAGYDIELTRAVAEAVSVPVIASGGAGTMAHFYDALTEGKADAALAASLFHYKELEIRDLKEYLASRSVSVRL